MLNFGWANSWFEEPDIIDKCRKLGHRVTDTNLDEHNTGLKHRIYCAICNYEYFYDSSD